MISVRAVAGLLTRDDKILVAQRPAGKPYSGYWEFPGGKIEANESGEHALARELCEELGISVISSQHLFDHTHTYPDKIVHLEIWHITAFSAEPDGKEGQALRWVTRDEMRELALLDGNWSILHRIGELT